MPADKLTPPPESNPPIPKPKTPKRSKQTEVKEEAKREERKSVFVFGIFAGIVIIFIALFCPNPTIFQYRVFQTILALSAAGIAAMIPGFIEAEIGKWVRAGGALAVFVLVMYKSPAALVVESVIAEPNITIEVKPDTVNIASGGFSPVDYIFRQKEGVRIILDSQDVRWLLEDGSELKHIRNARILGGTVSIPVDGAVELIDNVYLPPQIVEKAVQRGARRVSLETTFQGGKPGSSKPIGRAILSINIM